MCRSSYKNRNTKASEEHIRCYILLALTCSHNPHEKTEAHSNIYSILFSSINHFALILISNHYTHKSFFFVPYLKKILVQPEVQPRYIIYISTRFITNLFKSNTHKNVDLDLEIVSLSFYIHKH